MEIRLTGGGFSFGYVDGAMDGGRRSRGQRRDAMRDVRGTQGEHHDHGSWLTGSGAADESEVDTATDGGRLPVRRTIESDRF